MLKHVLPLVFLAALVTPAANAQTASHTHTPAPRSSGASRPSSTTRTQASALVPIDTAATSITSAQSTSFNALELRLSRVPPKSEFESWAAYAQRASGGSDWYALPVTCTPDGDRIFSYNAEEGRLRVDIPTPYNETRGAVMVACASTANGSFVGSNAFGVQRRISVTNTSQLAIRSSRPDRMFIPAAETWEVPSEQAAAMMPHLIAFLVVHPAAGESTPLLARDSDEAGATIDQPVQENFTMHFIGVDGVRLWVVDAVTRRVVFKSNLLGDN